MGRPGPAPKPALQVVREGNPGHRTSDRLERGLRLPPSAPAEPDWRRWFPSNVETGLGAEERKRRVAWNREAREAASGEWRRVVKILDAQGLLSELDLYVLVDYVVSFVRLGQLEQSISREGFVRQGQKGTARNGAITSATQYRTHLRWLTGELGLSPVARDFITPDSGGDDDGESPWDA